MTLNFNRTASECAEARLLYPTIQAHLEFDYGLLRRRDTGIADPRVRANQVFDDLLRWLLDEGFVEETGYWARTARDIRTRHGRYRLRTVLREWSVNERRGKTCLCGTTCRYPEAPAS